MTDSMTETSRTDEGLAHIADWLKAVADPTRLSILHLLAEGEICVGEIVTAVGGTQANVSKHLAVLRGAGLVKARRSGMNVCYSLEEPVVFEICDRARACLERQASERVAELGRAAPAATRQVTPPAGADVREQAAGEAG